MTVLSRSGTTGDAMKALLQPLCQVPGLRSFPLVAESSGSVCGVRSIPSCIVLLLLFVVSSTCELFLGGGRFVKACFFSLVPWCFVILEQVSVALQFPLVLLCGAAQNGTESTKKSWL